MNWAMIIVAVVGVWAMLTLIGGDRARRLGEVRSRLRAEAQAAAEAAQAKPSEEIISVG